MSIDNRGYSQNIVLANKEALKDKPDYLGVVLGQYCINRNIPASKIAKHFQVSRMTVYRWFDGTRRPRSKHILKMKKMLAIGGIKLGKKFEDFRETSAR
tara:strand:+ start:816 stop:1112 length:297 start_codon:yes stop_codon:yes gene_type:complete